MTSEQIEQLINSVDNLSNNSLGGDFWISVISAVIGGLFAYIIARYQVKKAYEQEGEYRKHDVTRQKLFMLDEMKLDMSQKMLNSTTSVNKDIINMTNIGVSRYNNLLEELLKDDERVNYLDGNATFEEKMEILKLNETIQDYLSNLYTVTELFDFTQEQKAKFKTLSDNIKKLHYQCKGDPINEYTNIPELTEICLKQISEFDFIVRKNHIELIKSMKGVAIEDKK